MTASNSQEPDDWFADADGQIDEEKSKSQLKREAEAKQKLAEVLVNMTDANLSKMPLDDALLDAVTEARKINRKKDGFRRQLQFLGKLMRSRDTQPIEHAVNLLDSQHAQANAHFHLLEHWRDTIVKQGLSARGDDVIETLVADYPALERQKLRQLQRKAVKQHNDNAAPSASRELFKYLKDTIQE